MTVVSTGRMTMTSWSLTTESIKAGLIGNSFRWATSGVTAEDFRQNYVPEPAMEVEGPNRHWLLDSPAGRDLLKLKLLKLDHRSDVSLFYLYGGLLNVAVEDCGVVGEGSRCGQPARVVHGGGRCAGAHRPQVHSLVPASLLVWQGHVARCLQEPSSSHPSTARVPLAACIQPEQL